MGALEESGKIEYHYGFYGAVHAEYEPTHIQMEYLQEHELGKEPVRMDMLVIKRGSAKLTDPVGSFFRTHNVLEYKSPEDSLSVDDFYKAQGYALIYKGLGEHVNAIPLEELTVSVFRHGPPRKLFEMLEAGGLKVQNTSPGIYRFEGPLSVPAQVVVISELPPGLYAPFKALGRGASREDILRLLSLADAGGARMVDHVRAVLRVSVFINGETITGIREAGTMTQTSYMEVLNQIFGEEFEKKKEEGIEIGIEKGIEIGIEKGSKKMQKVFYERLKQGGMPEAQARALAFG